jgi:hypothetical protein
MQCRPRCMLLLPRRGLTCNACHPTSICSRPAGTRPTQSLPRAVRLDSSASALRARRCAHKPREGAQLNARRAAAMDPEGRGRAHRRSRRGVRPWWRPARGRPRATARRRTHATRPRRRRRRAIARSRRTSPTAWARAPAGTTAGRWRAEAMRSRCTGGCTCDRQGGGAPRSAHANGRGAASRQSEKD